MRGSHKDLKVWQKAVDLALEVYRGTRCFPRDELYGLTSQIRRAAVSVPSNIAEGKGKSSDKELVLFLYHARGSLLEVETQLLIAQRLRYLDEGSAVLLLGLTEELAKMLNALINALKGAAAA